MEAMAAWPKKKEKKKNDQVKSFYAFYLHFFFFRAWTPSKITLVRYFKVCLISIKQSMSSFEMPALAPFFSLSVSQPAAARVRNYPPIARARCAGASVARKFVSAWARGCRPAGARSRRAALFVFRLLSPGRVIGSFVPAAAVAL